MLDRLLRQKNRIKNSIRLHDGMLVRLWIGFVRDLNQNVAMRKILQKQGGLPDRFFGVSVFRICQDALI